MKEHGYELVPGHAAAAVSPFVTSEEAQNLKTMSKKSGYALFEKYYDKKQNNYTVCFLYLQFQSFILTIKILQVAELHYNFDIAFETLKDMSKKKTIEVVVAVNSRARDDTVWAAKQHELWPVSIEDWEAHAPPRGVDFELENTTPIRRRRITQKR